MNVIHAIAPYLRQCLLMTQSVKRTVFIAAWVGLGLLLFGMFWQFSRLAVIERIELSLLDFRLKARADTLTPSDQIIVTVMDRQSQDEARNHPEWGLNSRVLRRRELARVIRFMADQGARAIVLDLSFESPQTPEDDQALAEAIRYAGNVYVAASMELSLAEYQARQQAISPKNARLDQAIAFHNYRLMPYLKKRVEVARWMATGCLSAYDGSGIGALSGASAGFPDDFLAALPVSDAFLRQVWQHQCQVKAPPLAGMDSWVASRVGGSEASVSSGISSETASGPEFEFEQGVWRSPLDLFYRR